MATYNGGKYIREQLDSIFSEISEHDEVIISDDSSSDDTIAIIESYRDPRIRLFKDQKFRSPILNFENAIRHANGDYIFLSDQDDVWLPGRVNTMLSFFPEFALVVCDCKVVDEQLNEIRPSYFASINARVGLVRNLVRVSSYIGCCMAFSRALATKALPFPARIPMHDFWIAMLAEATMKVKLVYKPLLLYRRHGSNASPTAAKSKNSFIVKVRIRLIILRALLLRLSRAS